MIENIEEFDEKIVNKIIRWTKAQISPIYSIIRGILGQETNKYTGKYSPINQWISFDFFEIVELQ